MYKIFIEFCECYENDILDVSVFLYHKLTVIEVRNIITNTCKSN